MSVTCKMLFPLAFMAKLHIHNNEHMTQQPAKVHCFTNRKTDNKTLKDKKTCQREVIMQTLIYTQFSAGYCTKITACRSHATTFTNIINNGGKSLDYK